MVIFKEMLGDKVELYVDDLVVKSYQRIDDLKHLGVIFNKLRNHQLKMNLLNHAFGVTLGKFLRFIVRHLGIEVDTLKIRELPLPKNIRILKGLQGCLAYTHRFI